MTEPHATSGRISLPGRAKLSKVASIDRTRPVLQHAHVYQHNGHRAIAATNSYCLVSLPVDDAVPLGPVNIEALKRIEAGETHSVNETGVEVIGGKTRQSVVYPMPKIGEAPDFKELLGYEPAEDETVVTIGLNPAMLKAIADALGASVGVGGGITIEIRVKDNTTLRPMRVRPLGARKGEGLLMPLRVEA